MQQKTSMNPMNPMEPKNTPQKRNRRKQLFFVFPTICEKIFCIQLTLLENNFWLQNVRESGIVYLYLLEPLDENQPPCPTTQPAATPHTEPVHLETFHFCFESMDLVKLSSSKYQWHLGDNRCPPSGPRMQSLVTTRMPLRF